MDDQNTPSESVDEVVVPEISSHKDLISKFSLSNLQIYCVLCAVGLLVYFKSIFFGFTYLDDNVLVLNNLPFLQDLGNIITAFARDAFFSFGNSAVYYRPILTLSFMFDANLGGALPFVYHLTNIAIHLFATCLLFKFLSKINYSRAASIFLSLIFVVHPVLTQAVSWIPGRNDSLLTVFVLASFIFFLKYIEEKNTGSIVWSSVFFLFAVFTKETAILLPLVYVIYIWVRRILYREILIKFGIGWVISIFIWFCLRYLAFRTSSPVSFGNIFNSIYGHISAIIQCIGKIIFPFNLSVLSTIIDTSFVWGILGLFLLITLLILKRRKGQLSKNNYSMIFFGFCWFVLFLLPSFINTNPNSAFYFSDHRLYLPMIGVLIIINEICFNDLLTKASNVKRLILLLPILLLFSGINFFHQNSYSDGLAFWRNAAVNAAHLPLAQKNLGAMYYLDGQYDLALQYYQKTLGLNPNEYLVHNNMGLIYANQRYFADAEVEYKKEIAINPSYDAVHYNLGLLYFSTGRIKDAKEEWQMTLQINPDYEDAKRALEQ